MCRHGGFLLVVAVVAGFGVLAFESNCQGQSASLSGEIRRAVERAAPAVVSIRVLDAVPPGEIPLGVPEAVRPLIPRRFRGVIPRPAGIMSAISGVVVDAERGGIVTCDHLLGGASRVEIVFEDGTSVPSTAIRRDARSDLALIVVDALKFKLTGATMADGAAPALGDWLVAIGRPEGEPVVISAGVSSGLRADPDAPSLGEVITADVRIHGSSRGAALVNLDGKCVGLVAGNERPGLEGLAIAIPSDVVLRVARDLGEYGFVKRSYLGVELRPGSSRGFAPSRVGVLSVAPNSPAERAKIQAGDMIVALDGKPLHGPWDLRRRIEFATPGQSIRVTIARGQEQREVNVAPELVPSTPEFAPGTPERTPSRRGSGVRPSGEQPEPKPETRLEPVPDDLPTTRPEPPAPPR